MNTLVDFVTCGKVGAIELMASRKQVADALGLPRTWFGKPPNWGPIIENAVDSPIWYYHGRSVGIRFEDGVSVSVLLYPQFIRDLLQLFADWPSETDLTMGQWRSFLSSRSLPFSESNGDDENYWILSVETCVAFCFSFQDGRLLHGHARNVECIEKFSNSQDASKLISRIRNGQ